MADIRSRRLDLPRWVIHFRDKKKQLWIYYDKGWCEGTATDVTFGKMRPGTYLSGVWRSRQEIYEYMRTMRQMLRHMGH